MTFMLLPDLLPALLYIHHAGASVVLEPFACRYEPVKIHDLKRLEKVKADMKLADVKVRRENTAVHFFKTVYKALQNPAVSKQACGMWRLHEPFPFLS